MSGSLDGDLLRTFLVVAETGNLTRAGDLVGRTQSTISIQLRRLEESVGAMLFERGARGVALTGAGSRLVPYAERIVGLMDETAIAMRSKPLDGPVRIGIPEEYGQSVLPRALAAFSDRHPAVEVTVKCGYSRQQMEALANNSLDLAIVFDWSRHTAGEVLCVDPTVWVTSLAYGLHERTPLAVAVYERSSWSRDFALRSLEQHGIDYRIAFTSDTHGGLKMAVSAGLGVTAMSRSTIPADCRELTAADGFPVIDSSRVVLRRNTRRSSEAIEALADMIREAFLPLSLNAPQGAAAPE